MRNPNLQIRDRAEVQQRACATILRQARRDGAELDVTTHPRIRLTPVA